MQVLVFGGTGQVGKTLAEFDHVTAVGRDQADFMNPQSCVDIIGATSADAIINAVAYTAVDKAEDESAIANQINGDTVTQMAKAAALRGIPFVQISTDYVFDGSGETAMTPDHAVSPVNAYGASKRIGEVGVSDAGGAHAILRTSWVFSEYGHNFVKTMLKLGATRDALTIVNDQIGGPTAARSIANACMEIAAQLVNDPKKSGVYHFSGAPDCSWADFAQEIFAQAGLNCAVTGIPTSDYPTPAKRPLNSRLNCDATTSVFGIERPSWQADLAAVLQKIG